MKTAVVNGQEISAEAVNFELDRLVRFYMGHGMTMAEIRQNLPKLEAKALDQADREAQSAAYLAKAADGSYMPIVQSQEHL